MVFRLCVFSANEVPLLLKKNVRLTPVLLCIILLRQMHGSTVVMTLFIVCFHLFILFYCIDHVYNRVSFVFKMQCMRFSVCVCVCACVRVCVCEPITALHKLCKLLICLIYTFFKYITCAFNNCSLSFKMCNVCHCLL